MPRQKRTRPARAFFVALLVLALTLALALAPDAVKPRGEASASAAPPEHAASAALPEPEPAPAAPPQLSPIQVESDCDASFTVAHVSGNTYKFTNTSTPLAGVTFKWTVFDENNSVLHTVTYLPGAGLHLTYTFQKSAENKNYTVRLEASGPPCGGDPDDEVQSVTVPGIKADFTYEQKSCPSSPLEVQFTNKSFGLNLTYDWSITPPATPVTYTVPNPVHTFPAPGTYNVCLKVTDSNGLTDQKCQTIVLDTSCKPSFDYVYSACQSNGKVVLPVSVAFTNTSKGGICPLKFDWTFDTGGPSVADNGATVYHPYNSFGPHTVTMVMEDSQGCATKVTKTINVQPCEADFTYRVCPTGRVIYRTDSPNPRWVFPGGEPSSGEGSEVTVDYAKPGSYPVALTSVNANHCRCVIEKKIVVSQVLKCARNDTESGNYGFTHKGKKYQLRYKITVRNLFGTGALGIHRIKAKAVLYMWAGFAWVPVKAREIRARWSGHTYTSDSECACFTPANEVQDSGVQNNRAKAMKVHDLGNTHEFCIRDQEITSTYTVKVDSTHTPVVRTLLSGVPKATCK